MPYEYTDSEILETAYSKPTLPGSLDPTEELPATFTDDDGMTSTRSVPRSLSSFGSLASQWTAGKRRPLENATVAQEGLARDLIQALFSHLDIHLHHIAGNLTSGHWRMWTQVSKQAPMHWANGYTVYRSDVWTFSLRDPEPCFKIMDRIMDSTEWRDGSYEVENHAMGDEPAKHFLVLELVTKHILRNELDSLEEAPEYKGPSLF